MKEWILGIWLGMQAGCDFKYKEISVWACIFAAVLGIIFCFIEKRPIESILLSLIPGLCSCGVSRITGEVIGYGDGIVLMVMAFFLPIKQEISILMSAFIIAGIMALVFLFFLKKTGNYRIPFIPFLFVGFLIEHIM